MHGKKSSLITANPNIKEMTTVSSIISDLDKVIEKGDSTKNVFKFPRALRSSLIELDKMVGVDEVKEMIVRLISTHVMKSFLGSNSPNTDVMNHILLLGDPGTGKTTIAVIIAKVICALGMLKEIPGVSKESNEDPFEVLFPHSGSNRIRVTRTDRSDDLTLLCKKSYDSILGIQNSVSEFCDSIYSGGKIVTLREEITKIETSLLDYVLDARRIMFLTERTEENNVQEKEDEFTYNIVISSREDLVSGYIGKTATKTRKRFEEASGGVLFIDEAYGLLNVTNSSVESFSSEAITTLCGCMSRYGENVVVIMAGYKDSTVNMIDSNEGMRRRFNHVVSLGNYSCEEVSEIFVSQLERSGLKIDKDIDLVSFVRKYEKVIGNTGAVTNQLSSIINSLFSLKVYNTYIESIGKKRPRSKKKDKEVYVDIDILEESIKIYKKKTTCYEKEEETFESHMYL